MGLISTLERETQGKDAFMSVVVVVSFVAKDGGLDELVALCIRYALKQELLQAAYLLKCALKGILVKFSFSKSGRRKGIKNLTVIGEWLTVLIWLTL